MVSIVGDPCASMKRSSLFGFPTSGGPVSSRSNRPGESWTSYRRMPTPIIPRLRLLPFRLEHHVMPMGEHEFTGPLFKAYKRGSHMSHTDCLPDMPLNVPRFAYRIIRFVGR